MASHFKTVENPAPAGKSGTPLVRKVRQSGRPEDHKSFLAARKEGFKALRNALDKRRRKS